jgi:hypothetical protein
MVNRVGMNCSVVGNVWPVSYRLSGPAVQSELLIVSLSTVQMKYVDSALRN